MELSISQRELPGGLWTGRDFEEPPRKGLDSALARPALCESCTDPRVFDPRRGPALLRRKGLRLIYLRGNAVPAWVCGICVGPCATLSHHGRLSSCRPVQ